MKIISGISLSLVLIIAVSCALFKKNSQMEVQDFVNEFETSLSKSDSIILALFTTQQSSESIIKFIRVLQNKTAAELRCEVRFSDALTTKDNDGIRVKIFAEIVVDTAGIDSRDTTSFVLRLTPQQGTYAITQLEGESFYNRFVSILYNVQGALSEEEEAAHYQLYFETVKTLREKYDSVVWVANYSGANYYYVVKGSWNAGPEGGDYTMGLVDQQGNVIVPVEYDRVGTIGFALENMVEVKRGGLYGYFDLSGENSIPAEYRMIIPFAIETAVAIVKYDGGYGWLNKYYQFKEGLPPGEAKRYVLNYEFLQGDMVLSATNYSLCEIPSPDFVRSGVIIPPSYLTEPGLLPEVISGLSVPGLQPLANIESVEASHTFFGQVMGKMNVLLNNVKTRYVMGREEFYEENEVMFINEEGEVISQDKIGGGSLEFKRIDSTLLEIKRVITAGGDYMEPSDSTELNIPDYTFFLVDQNQGISKTGSYRRFPFTEFVKLDSSYITGPFNYYSSSGWGERTYLSDATLSYMRNEILADYGFIFEDDRITDQFKLYDWYRPRFNDIEDVETLLNDKDRYNLRFLAKIIGPLKKNASI